MSWWTNDRGPRDQDVPSYLPPQTLQPVLNLLGPNRRESLRQLRVLHYKLTQMFRWQGSDDPERLASDTLRQSVDQLLAHAEIKSADPYTSLREVVFLVYREMRQEQKALRISKYLGVPHKHFTQLVTTGWISTPATGVSPHRSPLDSIDRSLEILEQVFGERGAVLSWLNSPHPDLGLRTPLDVILQGYPDAVEDMLEAALEGIPA